jgi:hypothetical protein
MKICSDNILANTIPFPTKEGRLCPSIRFVSIMFRELLAGMPFKIFFFLKKILITTHSNPAQLHSKRANLAVLVSW